jgi:rod shape determining protein RodA
MASGRGKIRFDWLTIFFYVALVGIGWLNIYSASLSDNAAGLFDFRQIYARQLVFIILSVFLIIFLLALDAKFYERFSSIIYIVSILYLSNLRFQ